MRKRDDIESGFLYRVVQRAAGSDDEWEHSNYGRPRTYMALSAARGMRTQMVRYNERRNVSNPLEFAVQQAPVTNWEIVPD